jgi:hypothetical protein
MTKPSAPARAPRRSIDQLMDGYLAQLAGGKRRAREVALSLELLRHGLDGYGYQNLSRADRDRWSAAFDDGDEAAFCGMFGARELARYLDEFLGYFLIRKVSMPEEEVVQTIEDVRGFVEWLADERELAPVAARKALGGIAAASVDLLSAERLGRLLDEIARAGEAKVGRRGAEPEFDEIVDDFLVIEPVAPGRIWFLDDVGPIKVPEAASAVARPGWTVNLVLGRRGTTWEVLEVGNVYPETLA